MAALEESRRNSADNDAQERVVQHLKQSERFRDEAKHLRSQTSSSTAQVALPSLPDGSVAPPHTGRPHRLHHAESAAADATHEVQRAKDEVDRARADHHRNESAESAHHLWEAERRHRLAQVASDHAHRRLKRQQHKMAVESAPARPFCLNFRLLMLELVADARRKLESAEVGTAEHEKASRDRASIFSGRSRSRRLLTHSPQMLRHNASYTSIGSGSFARTRRSWRLCERRRASIRRIALYSFISTKSRRGMIIESASIALTTRHTRMISTSQARPSLPSSQPRQLSTIVERNDTSSIKRLRRRMTSAVCVAAARSSPTFAFANLVVSFAAPC